MGLKARLSSYCTKRANNGMNLVTSRKINTRLARPITSEQHPDMTTAVESEAKSKQTNKSLCLFVYVCWLQTGPWSTLT